MALNGVEQIVQTIIKEQELVVGPVALELAQSVNGLNITNIDNVSVVGDPSQVLTKLVETYSKLFGNVSVEVCRNAVKRMKNTLPSITLPDVLS